MRRKLLLSVAAAVVLFTAAALAGVGRPGPASGADPGTTDPSVVTTSGHGSVSAIPDQAVVSAGVNTQAASAADALSQNAAAMQKVIAALKAAGGTDLQTQEVSLYPQTDDKGTVTGYSAQNTVSATAKVADAGGLVDAAVGAGANTISGPNLSVSDQDELYRNALKQAVANAREKAEAIASAGGFSVGAVYSVSEQTASAPQPVFEAARVAKAASTPVEAGSQDVTADVTVSFSIK